MHKIVVIHSHKKNLSAIGCYRNFVLVAFTVMCLPEYTPVDDVVEC